jgi:eukaryotic-like serine/threonine-protein kinase
VHGATLMHVANQASVFEPPCSSSDLRGEAFPPSGGRVYARGVGEPFTNERPLKFGPYSTLGRLGEGGMGVVYVARHGETGVDVALKTVRLARRPNLAGLRAEVKALASLRHPGIVEIADFGVGDGAPWYAMELLHGQSFGQYMAKVWGDALGRDPDDVATVSDVESRLVEANVAAGALLAGHHLVRRSAAPLGGATRRAEMLRITRDLCRALSYLHQNGLLHGDLKPSNIFVCRDGRVVLLDFGLVSQAGGGIGREVLESAGAIRGTVPYLAPERLRGDFSDARADLFGVGVMLYEALTGRLPFGGARASELLAAQQAGVVALPSHLVSDLPPEIDLLTRDLLAFSPRERLGHADDVVAVLESLGVPAAAASPKAGEGPRTTYLYRPPLVGRDEVLERWDERLSSAAAGQGGIVMLTGESGVGKTALMAELGRRATRRHLTVVHGECISLGAGRPPSADVVQIKEAPLHPFRGLLQDVVDRCSEWSASTVGAILGPRAKLLARYEPALGSIPGWSGFAEPAELPPDAALQRLMREVRSLLVALTETLGPMLLLIDDLQWGDELSLRFLRSLDAEFFRGTPILFVATVRHDEMNADLRSLFETESAEVIRVERLDEAGVEQMIGGMLSMNVPPRSLVSFLARQSEGNPFFVAEYLRLAVEARVVERRAGRWRVASDEGGVANVVAGLKLPGSLQELVDRRLASLDADAREAVNVAAIVGRTFELGLLADVLGVDEEQARRRLREPTSLTIVEDEGKATLRFAHDKLREAAAAALGAERSRELHGRVARCIEARCKGDRAALTARSPELVHHYKLAQEPLAAIGVLELAGEAALRKSAHREAALLLEDALATVERSGVRVDARRRARWERMIGEAYLALGQHDVSLAHFEVALAALGAPVPGAGRPVAASFLGLLGTQLAHRLGLRAPAGAPHAGSELLLERAQIHDRLLQIHFYRGDALPRMLHAMMSSMNLAERAGPSPYRALGYVNAGATAGILPLRGLADHYFRLAREALEAQPNDEVGTFVDLLEAHYRFGCGDFARATRALTAALEVSERMGFLRRWEELAGLHRSVLVAEGRFEEALTVGEQVLASCKRGDLQVQCWELLGRAQLRLIRGDAESALRDASVAAELASGQLRQERLRANGVLALARLRCGDLEGARKAADLATIEIEAGPPLGPYWLDPHCDVIDVRFASWDGGDIQDGRRVAERAVASLDKFARVFPFARARAHLYRGHLLRRQGKRDRAHREWRLGLGLAEASALPYEIALAEAALGASLGHVDPEARTRLERARGLLRELRAVYALREVEATGLSPEGARSA